MTLHRIFLMYDPCTYSSLNRYINLCVYMYVRMYVMVTTILDGIKHLHQISCGPCDMKSGYGEKKIVYINIYLYMYVFIYMYVWLLGIMMAEACGFPREVLDESRALRKIVRESFPLMFCAPPSCPSTPDSKLVIFFRCILFFGSMYVCMYVCMTVCVCVLFLIRYNR